MRRNASGIRSYGHGKFFNVIDSYVYELSLVAADEELGDVENFGFYAAVKLGPEALFDVGAQAEEDGDELTADEKRYIRESAGAILRVRNDGIVEVEYYDYPEDFRETWLKLEMEYEDWLEKYGEEEDY